ncbi:MAG: C40 family peptidase, partial [Actinobacteria bacterium]|nr:C40 family peptidase [Actinomycetota bacterium]
AARPTTTTPSGSQRGNFTVTAPVISGSHTLCVVARNVGAGLDTVLGCVPTPLGTVLTPSQLAQHSPVGLVTAMTPTGVTLRVQGWASDPDDVARADVVVLYLDGNPAFTANTGPHGGAPAGYGPRARFDFTVPVATGAHVGCVWVVNVGLGSNTFAGCQAVDTRGPAGSGPVSTPAVNLRVLAEAKKHIGQRYVWGTAGPKTFDCSGLVEFSYGIAGMSTLPGTSEAQFAAARLIPASRVQPGDLVFTHDSEGDVYHVGIYVSPGKALAAIDTAQGVNYQSIWDPAATTYGSFTHT